MAKQRPSRDSRYGTAPGARAAAVRASAFHFLTNLFPPARQPITFNRLLPLIIFMVGFPLLCLLLDRSETIVFSRLWPFWFIGLAPWIWWLHEAGYHGLTKGRALAALAARLTLLGLFIVALAEPRAVRKDEGLSIVFVVDASASIRDEARSEAIRYVLEIAHKKPQDDQVGLVFFGRSAAVELPPQTVVRYDSNNNVMNVQIDHDGTDISKALALAAAMLPKEKNGRIVLISDGVETEGGLSATLDDLKSKGIAVDVMPVAYSYEDEVWLEHLELPRSVKVGEEYNATVILSSLKKGKGKLTLLENGQPFFTDEVEFEEGKNRFEVPIRLRQAGYYEYQANIEVADVKDSTGRVVEVRDHKKENNKAVSHLYLRGKGKVLVVTDPAGDPRDFSRLSESLTAANREVEIQSSLEFARDAAALLPYDCIIFANVPAGAFDVQQLEAVHEAIYSQGSGFLMVGGANSYGPGGYHKTAVERALPVSMDLSQKKVLPKGALAIILHTCEFPQGNTWGKNIAKQAIKVLNERDEVCVLAQDFAGNDYFVAPLTPAGEYEDLAKKINNASLGDMMAFGPTMQMGLNALKNSDASAKHMIIISDGDPQPPSPQMLQQFVNAQISVTTVSIWPHGGAGGNEVTLMTNIAKLTGGRHYLPQDPNQLPAIFIKEATTLRRSAIQNITFTPTVNVTSQVLEGITALPQLKGYVLTTPKEKSLTILDGPEEDEIDPVLSTWRYGLGATAAWTSDLSPNWASDWVQWQKYDAFVKQLITSISRISDDGTLRMRTFASGGQGVVIIEDYGTKDTFLVMEGNVEGPRGLDKPVTIKQVGPNRYEGRFPLSGEGTYKIVAVGAGADGKPQRVHGRFVMPYSQEYLRFRSNPIVLQQIAQKTGGTELVGESAREVEQLYSEANRQAKRSSAPIIDWVLLLLACLIPLDVGLRRVQLDWGVIKGWLTFGREAPSEATMSALKARKEKASKLTDRAKDKPATGASSTRATEPAMKIELKKPDPARPAAPTKKADQPESTASATSRLLAAKKRAQDKQEKKE